jgi:hypothetical protein
MALGNRRQPGRHRAEEDNRNSSLSRCARYALDQDDVGCDAGLTISWAPSRRGARVFGPAFKCIELGQLGITRFDERRNL